MVMISDWEQVRVTIGMEILMEKFLRQRDLLGKKHSMWSCGDVCSTLEDSEMVMRAVSVGIEGTRIINYRHVVSHEFPTPYEVNPLPLL